MKQIELQREKVRVVVSEKTEKQRTPKNEGVIEGASKPQKHSFFFQQRKTRAH